MGLDLGQVLLWAETAILATSYGEKPASYAHLIESLPPQPLPEGTVVSWLLLAPYSVCICICECAYMCIYVCVCVCMYVCMHEWMASQ